MTAERSIIGIMGDESHETFTSRPDLRFQNPTILASISREVISAEVNPASRLNAEESGVAKAVVDTLADARTKAPAVDLRNSDEFDLYRMATTLESAGRMSAQIADVLESNKDNRSVPRAMNAKTQHRAEKLARQYNKYSNLLMREFNARQQQNQAEPMQVPAYIMGTVSVVESVATVAGGVGTVVNTPNVRTAEQVLPPQYAAEWQKEKTEPARPVNLHALAEAIGYARGFQKAETEYPGPLPEPTLSPERQEAQVNLPIAQVKIQAPSLHLGSPREDIDRAINSDRGYRELRLRVEDFAKDRNLDVDSPRYVVGGGVLTGFVASSKDGTTFYIPSAIDTNTMLELAITDPKLKGAKVELLPSDDQTKLIATLSLFKDGKREQLPLTITPSIVSEAKKSTVPLQITPEGVVRAKVETAGKTSEYFNTLSQADLIKIEKAATENGLRMKDRTPRNNLIPLNATETRRRNDSTTADVTVFPVVLDKPSLQKIEIKDLFTNESKEVEVFVLPVLLRDGSGRFFAADVNLGSPNAKIGATIWTDGIFTTNGEHTVKSMKVEDLVDRFKPEEQIAIELSLILPGKDNAFKNGFIQNKKMIQEVNPFGFDWAAMNLRYSPESKLMAPIGRHEQIGSIVKKPKDLIGMPGVIGFTGK